MCSLHQIGGIVVSIVSLVSDGTQWVILTQREDHHVLRINQRYHTSPCLAAWLLQPWCIHSFVCYMRVGSIFSHFIPNLKERERVL